MAKYHLTVEIRTCLCQDVEANAVEDAERLADAMYQAYLEGDRTHITGTAHHQRVELLSEPPRARFESIGE